MHDTLRPTVIIGINEFQEFMEPWSSAFGRWKTARKKWLGIQDGCYVVLIKIIPGTRLEFHTIIYIKDK